MSIESLFALFEKEEKKRYKNSDPFNREMRKNIYSAGYEYFKAVEQEHRTGGKSPTGENIDAYRKGLINFNEAAVIYMYTAYSIYDEVNSEIRNNSESIDKDVKYYCELLNQALRKMPSCDNAIVYRDISCAQGESLDILNEYQRNINVIKIGNP